MSSDKQINFASTLDEAKLRFSKYELSDPFPDLDCSLLNSSDIAKYISRTGMIFPFVLSQLKPATYALTIGGRYIYWEPSGEKREGILAKGSYLTLKKDSIIFIALEPYIQLPQYIAARFNLKIDHIYKGLLLGTGPIVDPGFVGYLSIPLHNFTSNDYVIKGGETFIWMEFTKLSPHPKWANSTLEVDDYLIHFPEQNRNKVLDDYVYEADERPIQSSIPLSVGQSAKSAKKAEKAAKNARTLSFVIVGINFALIATVVYYVFSVYTQASSIYDKTKKDLKEEYKEQFKTDSIKIKGLQNQIDSLTKKLAKIKT